nr:class I SAM-dependent methyltransferase [uncultured Sphingomonas sp.]
MTIGDNAFTGSIPDIYQRYLVPLLFQPWARLIADRAAELQPRRILELAAGTGVVTAALIQACPRSEIVATDLNPAMLDIARRSAPTGGQVSFLAADACHLPFDMGTFDVAVSQFGMMFYPDCIRGFAEAARILTPEGTYLALVWGGLDENPVSEAIQHAMNKAFPHDPPRFLARTPFSYHDADHILEDARSGGFERVSVERITLPHPRLPSDGAAIGMITGSPLYAEIDKLGPDAINVALAAAKAELTSVSDEDGRIAATMTALMITARR